MTEWLARYEEGGETFFRIGRDGDDIVAEWPGIVRLVARRDGSSHRVEPDPNADSRELAKVQRGGVQLLLRHLAGKLGLHGAAVAFENRGIVFLGRATQGKSTLAAALCARSGAALLADDAVALDLRADGHGYVVSALEEMHFLDADARYAVGMLGGESAGSGRAPAAHEGKAAVHALRTQPRAELVALVELAFTDGPPSVARATPIEAMNAVVPQAVRFVLDDPAVHRRELDELGRLIETVPTFRLERPRNLALLSASCDLVAALGLDSARADR